jgi:hypothetical protein
MATKPTKWDKLPSMSEDVVRRSREDIGAIRRGMGAGASKLSGTAQDVVKEAGARGLTRMAGRVAPAVAALDAGYTLGREIDERTGAGKKMVDDSGLGRAAGRAALVGREGARLSEGAKQRMADMENDEALRAVDAERKASKYGKGDEEGMKRGGKVKAYANGGSASASSRADGIAAKGKTRGRMC